MAPVSAHRAERRSGVDDSKGQVGSALSADGMRPEARVYLIREPRGASSVIAGAGRVCRARWRARDSLLALADANARTGISIGRVIRGATALRYGSRLLNPGAACAAALLLRAALPAGASVASTATTMMVPT